MRFEARELKPHGKPVSLESLKVGEVYFAFFVLDKDGKVPTLLPRVFIGRNLEPDDENARLTRVTGSKFHHCTDGLRHTRADAH